MRNQKRQGGAKIAAGFIAQQLGIEKDSVSIGLILGTGWSDAMNYQGMKEIPLSDIRGFKHLQELEGPKRSLFLGEISGKPVLILKGRIHLNEAPNDPEVVEMVRLQTEMLLQLGVKTLIATAAVGALKRRNASEIDPRFTVRGDYSYLPLEVGDIAVIDGFVTAYAPIMPLWAWEFYSPDDAISERLNKIALSTDSALRTKEVGHVMMRGPQFEGRKYDKALLSASGAECVGMSILPEACVAALYEDVEFLGIGFVTNDDIEVHSDEGNKRRAQASAVFLNEYLEKIIAKI